MQDVATPQVPGSKLDGFHQYHAATPPAPAGGSSLRDSPRRIHLIPSSVQTTSSTKNDLGELLGSLNPQEVFTSPALPQPASSCKLGTGQAEYCTACFMTGARPLQSCLMALLAPVVDIPEAATGAAQWRALCSGIASKAHLRGVQCKQSTCSDAQLHQLLEALINSKFPPILQLVALENLSHVSHAAAMRLAAFLLHHGQSAQLECLRISGCQKLFAASRGPNGGFSLLPTPSNVLPSTAGIASGAGQRPGHVAPPNTSGHIQGRLRDTVEEAATVDALGSLRPIASHTKPSFVSTGASAPAGTVWPSLSPRGVQRLTPSPVATSRKVGAPSKSGSRKLAPGTVTSRGGNMRTALLDADMRAAVAAAEAASESKAASKKAGSSAKRVGAGKQQKKKTAEQLPQVGAPLAESALHPTGVLMHLVARRCQQLTELDMSHNSLSSGVALHVVLPPLLVPESQVYASLATLNLSWNSMGMAAVLLCFLLLNKRLTVESAQAFVLQYLPQQRQHKQQSAKRGAQRQQPSQPQVHTLQSSQLIVTDKHAASEIHRIITQAGSSAQAWSDVCAAVDVSGSAAGARADHRVIQHALQRAALAADLSQASRFNSSLAYLELSMCGIDDCTGALLLQCACGSETLRSLDLSHNALRSDAAVAAEKLIVNSKSLLSLDLGFNPLGWEGTVRLVQALQANDSVVELSVENTLVQTQFHASADSSVPDSWHLPEEAAPAVQPHTSAGRAKRAPSAGQSAKTGTGKHTKQPSALKGSASRGIQSSLVSGGSEASVSSLGAAQGKSQASLPHSAEEDDDTVPTPPSHSEAYQMLHEICSGILARRGTYAQVNFEYPPQHRLMGTFKYAHLTRSASGRWLGLQAEKSSGDWSLQRSVWRPRLLECDSRAFYDTQSIMNRAFEADVHCSKLDRMLKDSEQLTNLKVKLRRRYPVLRELFRYYCCSGGSAASGIDPFSMSFQQFTEWRRDSGIEATNLTQHLDMAFIAANSSLPGQANSDPTASDRRLRRHEFLEAVVRTAMVMFPPDMTDPDGPAASVSRLMEHHVLPTVSSLLNVTDPAEPWSNSWRRARLYTQPVDRVLKLYLPTLREIFDKFSRTVNTNELTHLTNAGFAINTKQRAGRRHEEAQESQRLYRKRFLFLEPFITLVQSAGCMKKQTGDASSLYQAWLARKTGKQQTLEGQAAEDKAAELVFTKRDAMSVFVFSSMTTVSEVQRDLRSCRRCLHNSLTFTGFLEAVARLADSSACPAPNELIGNGMGSQRHLKGALSSKSRSQGADGGAAASLGQGSLQASFKLADTGSGNGEKEDDMDLGDVVSVASSGGDTAETEDSSVPPEDLQRRLPLIITMLARGAQVPIQLSSNLDD